MSGAPRGVATRTRRLSDVAGANLSCDRHLRLTHGAARVSLTGPVEVPMGAWMLELLVLLAGVAVGLGIGRLTLTIFFALVAGLTRP